jgi:hypothetical protein
MFARFATIALAACACASTDTFGQVYYGGYKLGPDFNAMINQGMANMNNIVKQAEEAGARAVQQAMNDPRCQAMYQQHQQQGGRMSLQQFAYEYARTGGFTQQGKINAFNVEQNNQAKEKQAYDAWQAAQRNASNAINQWQEGYRRNQNEAGNVMTGKMTYVDPNGRQFVLPYLQPGYTTDRNTGTVYHLDQFGRYHYMQNNSGYWVPLNPGR